MPTFHKVNIYNVPKGYRVVALFLYSQVRQCIANRCACLHITVTVKEAINIFARSVVIALEPKAEWELAHKRLDKKSSPMASTPPSVPANRNS